MLAPLTEGAKLESQGASGRYRCPFVADFVEKLFE
jgi:hypothetical protein